MKKIYEIINDQRESAQEDIRCILDGFDDEVVDNCCQVIVDRLNALKREVVSTTSVDVGNLLMNLSAGLLPRDLTSSEIEMLKSEFGLNWFRELGYNDLEYERPRVTT